MDNKVTMQHIADYIGVSKFVVSKALSGKKGVSLATREKVIKTATQLGYFANKGMRSSNAQLGMRIDPSNASDKKQTLLVLMPNVRFQTKESSYWGRILEGISAALESKDIGMVIITDDIADNFANIINPDGYIGIIGVGLITTSQLLVIHNLSIPLILIDHEDPLIPADSVFVNNAEGISRITQYLLGLGHTSMQFVGNTSFSRSFYDRWNGFKSCLEDNHIISPSTIDQTLLALSASDIPQLQLELNPILTRLVKADSLPTAFVCANDNIAISVIQVLQQLNISVPGQVCVTGFDNIEDSMIIEPSLTTFGVAKEFLGRQAVEMLLWRKSNEDYPIMKVSLSGNMIIRKSTAPYINK